RGGVREPPRDCRDRLAGREWRHDATRQELPKLALDELRQTAPIRAGSDLCTKRLEVLADDSVEDRALHRPGLVAGGAYVRSRSQRHAAPDAARKRPVPRGTVWRIQRSQQHGVARAGDDRRWRT